MIGPSLKPACRFPENVLFKDRVNGTRTDLRRARPAAALIMHVVLALHSAQMGFRSTATDAKMSDFFCDTHRCCGSWAVFLRTRNWKFSCRIEKPKK